MKTIQQCRRAGRLGWLLCLLLASSWIVRGEEMKEMERMEKGMLWHEGMEMNRKGEVFKQGDSVDFVEDVVVGLMDDITCGVVQVEEGVEVTVMPYSGNLYMEELRLEGTMIFTAPWVLSNHWVIHVGEKGKIVMDMEMFDEDLRKSLPGKYEGALEIWGGRMRYRQQEGELHFKSLSLYDGAQLVLEGGSDYNGEIVLSGHGWSKSGEERGEGSVLFENNGDDCAVLSGHIMLADETVLNVAREGDCGVIDGELDAAGYKLIKAGAGELRVVSERVRGLNEVEVREGMLSFTHKMETESLHVAGAGELELQGQGNRVGLLEVDEGMHVRMQDGEIGELCGGGEVSSMGGELRVHRITDFRGEIHAANLWLGGVDYREGAEALVDLRDVERICLADGVRVEVRSVRSEGGTTIYGAGELRIHARRMADGELSVGALAIEGARVHLMLPGEEEASEVGRVEVRESGKLLVELSRSEGNAQLVVGELELQRGSRLELVLNLSSSMLYGTTRSEHALLSGVFHAELGAELSLHIADRDLEFDFSGGRYMEFLLADHFSGDIAMDAETALMMKKYFGNTAQLIERDGKLLLTGTTVTEQTEHFHRDAARTPNGRAGAGLLDALVATEDPQHHDRTGARAGVLRAQERLIAEGNGRESDLLDAAVAGSSLPTLSLAFSRAARAGLRGLVDQLCDSPSIGGRAPHGGSWSWNIQTDGVYSKLGERGTFSGFSLRTAGGTIGARRTYLGGKAGIGAALNIDNGDWKADAADCADGEFNMAFLTAYGVWRARNWRHLMALQAGYCTVRPERHVSFGEVAYNVRGRTHGQEEGILYELMYGGWSAGRGMNGLRPFLQATWQWVTVASYDEHGSDAALHVGRQQLQRGTLGAGVEWSGQSHLVERRINWKLRGGIVANLGDRSAEAGMALLQSRGHIEKVHTARETVPELEFSAALIVPTAQGSWYATGGVEIQNHSTAARLSVGYNREF